MNPDPPTEKTDSHVECPNCGYDLFGIEGTVCPECGKTPSFLRREEIERYMRRTTPHLAVVLLSVPVGILVAGEAMEVSFVSFPLGMFIFGIAFGASLAGLGHERGGMARLLRLCIWMRATAILSIPLLVSELMILLIHIPGAIAILDHLLSGAPSVILLCPLAAIPIALVQMFRTLSRFQHRETQAKTSIGWYVLPAILTCGGAAVLGWFILIGDFLSKGGI